MRPRRDPAASPAAGRRSCSAGRRRPRPQAWAAICAVFLAFAWPVHQGAAATRADTGRAQALSMLSANSPGQAVQDTITVSPSSVSVGQATTLGFTYTAAARDPFTAVTVTLLVPDGWPPPTAPGNVSCATAGCRVSTSGMAIMASFSLDVGATSREVRAVFVVDYTVTAPDVPGTSTFAAAEQYATAVVAAPTLESPQVTLTCPDGQGTMTGPGHAVTAASVVSLTFTYQAGSCGTGPGGAVTLTVPAGWTPPVTTPGALGFVTSTGGGGPPATTGLTITVPAESLGPGGTVTIDYATARAPGVAARYPFATGEESSADDDFTALATSPQVTVTSSLGSGSSSTPATGRSSPPSQAGLMTVRPAGVLATQTSTLTFTYEAPRTGLPPSGEITVDVPVGWTAPSPSPGQVGYARSEEGALSVAGRQIVVTGVTLAGGRDLTITYTGRAAPSAAGRSAFVTAARSDGTARLTVLPASPSVTVALAGAAGGPSRWLVTLLAIGLVAAASAAGVLARRQARRPGWTPAGPSVRAMPHTGAPASVVIHDTGIRPTLTVRIEPHASAAVTTIRGDRR